MEIIPVTELKIGMFVVEPDCPWTELPFPLQGFVVDSLEQLGAFRGHCRLVQIDRSRSQGEHYAAVARAPGRSLLGAETGTVRTDREASRAKALALAERQADMQRRRRRFLAFLHGPEASAEIREVSRELDYIEPRYDNLIAEVRQAFQHIAVERQFDLGNVRQGVTDLVGSLERNPDAVMWLLRLKQADQYSFDHAMDVAVHLLMFGNHIGWRGKRLLDLGIAGLLQDVGKTQVPPELLAKATALDADEQQLIRSHVASSLEILMSQHDLSPDILQYVARHHERWDGSGYPRGLMASQIGLGGEMAGLADSFCAMLKNKPYRSAIGHQQALEELFKLRDKQFNPALMEQFVQCVGLYPVGTLVELNSGEVALVIQQNRVQRARPTLLLLLDADKQEINDYRVLDLRQPGAAGQRIARALPQDAYELGSHDFAIA